MFKIDISDVNDFLSQLWRFNAYKALHEGIKKSMIIAESTAKVETPIKDWRLRKSYFIKVYGLTWILQNDTEYWVAVHEGVWPYTIRAKPWKALYWKWAKHPVKKVNHPWIKANPFLERTAEKIEPRVVSILTSEVKNHLKFLKK